MNKGKELKEEIEESRKKINNLICKFGKRKKINGKYKYIDCDNCDENSQKICYELLIIKSGLEILSEKKMNKEKELKHFEIEKLYQNCIGKLNCEDVDTSNLEEYEGVIIAFMEQAELKGRQDKTKEFKDAVEKAVNNWSGIVNKDGLIRAILKEAEKS